jgi:hypothetical protein
MLRRKGELDSMGRCFEDSDRMCFSTTTLGNFVYSEVPTNKNLVSYEIPLWRSLLGPLSLLLTKMFAHLKV